MDLGPPGVLAATTVLSREDMLEDMLAGVVEDKLAGVVEDRFEDRFSLSIVLQASSSSSSSWRWEGEERDGENRKFGLFW